MHTRPVPCCHLTRRQLAYLAAASAVPLGTVMDTRRASAATPRLDPTLVVQDLELVTLTETSVVLTWTTSTAGTPDATGRLMPRAADTTVLMGTSPAALVEVYGDNTQTPYHYAEITGLEPGQTYSYVALSNGQPATPAPAFQGNPVGTGPLDPGAGTPGSPFSFTTPQPPAGRFLFSLALANDVHMGETVAGLATSSPQVGPVPGMGLPPGISGPVDGMPYPEAMARALAADVRARGAARTLIAGDITSEASRADSLRAKQILDGIGTLGVDYLVARGNHDRSHSPIADCSPSRVPGVDSTTFQDCFSDVFGVQDAHTWFRRDVGGLRLLALDTYEKPGNGGDNGILAADQYAFLTDQLSSDPDRPTLVFGHHPITVESTLVNLSPVRFDLDPQQALMIEQLYAGAPGVFFHQAGHTHRNKRSTGTLAEQVTFHETAATKEYPGGFSLLRVHTGGYALNFYKTRSEAAREWSDRTRQEYEGQAAYYTNGTIADRNYVVSRDLSGLSEPEVASASLPEAPLALALPLAAAAVGAGALAARAAVNRARR